MTLTTLSIDAQLSTNEEAPIVGEMTASGWS